MSSLQIAEITGKRHDAILRDIKNLLSQGVTAHNFVVSDYKDVTGRTLPCYALTKKGCLILASGYNAKLREKIIDRWEELETGQSQPIATSATPLHSSTVKAKIAVAKFLSSFLNLNDSSKLLIAKSIADPLGLPTPDYTPSQSHTQPLKKTKKSTKNLWFSGKMSNFASSYFRSGGMTAEQMRFGIFYALTSIYNGFVPPCYGLMPITAASGVGQRDRRNRFLMSHYNKQC